MKEKTIADLLEELIYEVSEDDVEYENPKYIKELKEEINKRLNNYGK